MQQTTRDQMRVVLRRASACKPGVVTDTELFYGTGGRYSPAQTYESFDLERISPWTPDVDPHWINWGLSATTGFREKLVVEHSKELNIDWWLLVDTARTMDFGTAELKRVLAAVLDASLIQTAGNLREKVAHVVYDESRLKRVHEPAAADDVLATAVQDVLETGRNYSRKRTNNHGAAASGSSLIVRALRRIFSRRKTNSSHNPADKSPGGLAYALRQLPDEPAIVVVISDFMHMTEVDKYHLVTAAKQHKVFCLLVEDVREREFPNGAGMPTLRDMTTGNLVTMTFTEANALVAEDHATRMDLLNQFFRKARCTYQVFSTEESPEQIRRKLERLLNR
jgi:hypothetical protein